MEPAKNGKGSALRREKKRTYAGTRLRRFVFTLNNWTDDELEDLMEFPCQWMVIGKEIGESGTKHLQGRECPIQWQCLYCLGYNQYPDLICRFCGLCL